MPTTSSHGIYYPNSTSPPQVWADMQTAATSVETALTTYETWTSWTPVYTTGPTTLGAGGVSEGFYQQIGKMVHAEWRTELGTGFAFTGTTFEMVLPLPAYVGWGGAKIQASLGSWLARDDSVPSHFAGTIGLWAAAGLSCSFGGAWNGTSPSSRVSSSATNPITWAAGDIFGGVLTYRAA